MVSGCGILSIVKYHAETDRYPWRGVAVPLPSEHVAPNGSPPISSDSFIGGDTANVH